MEVRLHPIEAVLDLSVVAPARDEAPNVGRLVGAVEQALGPLGIDWELIVVDDGSRDGTREAVRALLGERRPWLRCLALRGSAPGVGVGQSAALAAGYRAARGRLVASLDADLQNDPADLVQLLEHLERGDADLVQGDRSRSRQDGAVRRFGSLVGRLFRRALLGDPIRDTGCSLRLMKQEVARSLPLELAGMHRFVPALARQHGYRVEELPVSHHPRYAGTTKYGLGLHRALPSLIDLLAVRYMASRRRSVRWEEIEP